jgi:pyruvate dehydrogenase E2 component (dihydrolipoamide acetyltransferase)
MTYEFKLPDLGEGVQEGQVMRLMVAPGDHVTEDQPLMEVETDKAAVEIPSPYTGVVAAIHVSEQQVVNVGEVMVTFADSDADAAAVTRAPKSSPAPGGNGAPTVKAPAPKAAPASSPSGRRKPASPAVRKLARRLSVEIETISGSGPGGRVLRSDVEQAAAAPAARAKLAQPLAPAMPSAPPPPMPIAQEIRGTDSTDDFGPVTIEPMSQTRKMITRIMTQSVQTIPHVTDCDDADVTELDALRKQYNAPGDRPKLNMLAYVIRAVVRALQMYPVFNASVDEANQQIIYKRYYHIAVGVQTPRGLVAPVLRDADTLTIPQIGAALDAMIERTRTGQFSMDELSGATYTISNAGAMGGSRYATPIINLPQVAVLAVGRSRLMPWVVDGAITPRLIMPLSHSMDHRLIDGAIEIAFMRHVIGDLENPGRFLI